MSGATSQYRERGAFQRLPTSRRAYHDGGEAQSNTTPSMATSITEHDFRFPRRPDQHEPTKRTTAQSNSIHPSRSRHTTAAPRSKLDQSTGDSVARSDILRGSLFPAWKDDIGGEEDLDDPEEMQKKDPLATQIWKLYARTKKSLPNQKRMENLTWRMMAMTLHRKRQEEAARYVLNGVQSQGEWSLTCASSKVKQARMVRSAPSGIAQLRKSSDHTFADNSDTMNLDDFIFTDNIATPAGIDSMPSPDVYKMEPERSSNAVASAIPIKFRKESFQQMGGFPQSVPVNHHAPDEFNYVRRHVRKTSIDERRVSAGITPTLMEKY